MRNRRSPRPVERLKTSLRVTLGIATASLSAFIIIMMIVINSSRQENSLAGNPMVFTGTETFQDTTFVYRGSMDQQGIGIMIQTSGEANALNITSIDFKASLTNGRLAEAIENARLWSTGNDPGFYCVSQIGKTLPMIPEEGFSMTVDKSLLPGKNYFWLTFDLKADAPSPSFLDVAVGNIRLGAISYRPFISSPVGNRLISGNQAYYSAGDGILGQAESWNSKRDGSGEKPADMKHERNVYFIQSNHHMQAVSPVSMAALFIEKGGQLKSIASLKLKRLVLETDAVYEQSATVTDFNWIHTFVMANGSCYIHNNTGFMPGRYHVIAPASTQKFLQYGPATFPTTVTWGNVVLESTSRLNFDLQKNFRHVQGNMEFRQTGQDNYLYCDASDTLDINGDLIFSGGNFIGVTGHNHNLLIRVGGNLEMRAGTFTDAEAVGTSMSHSILQIGGDVTFNGGMFDYAQSVDRGSELSLVSGKTSTIKLVQKQGEVLLGNVRIMPGKQVFLDGPYLGNVAADHSFIVEPHATLWCGKTQITGGGRFVLENNARIAIGHAAGINSTSMDGNILTTKRVFSSGARYTYYQEINPQATGKFLTEPVAGTIRELTIEKDAASQWVILSQDLLVMENISIKQGIIEKNSSRLLKTDPVPESTMAGKPGLP